MNLRSHLTYANVMASIAVFIAMGGGAYALSLPKNSVGAKQVKRNAVGASEIRAGAVRTSEVKNGSLLAADFGAGQLPVGPQGPQGPAGPATGPAGGDLTGSYPNPLIGPNAIDGGNVFNDSLAGADIDETTLGEVPSADDADALNGIGSSGFGTGALMGRVNSLAASGPATQYGSPSGTSVAANTETEVAFISTNSPMTLRELRAGGLSLMPAGASRTFTVRALFADTALSCTIEENTAGCVDVTDDVTVDQGTALSIEVETTGSPGIQGTPFSLRVVNAP
jgi:hypothetical protein